MKYLLIVIALSFSSFAFGQQLNGYGHIINEEEPVYQQQIVNGLHHVMFDGMLLRGSGLYYREGVIATVESSCGNLPATLRLFNEQGVSFFSETFPQIFNGQLNPTGEYFSFMSQGQWEIFNTQDFSRRQIPSTYPIAVDENGEVAYYDAEAQTVFYKDLAFLTNKYPLDLQIDEAGTLHVFQRNRGIILPQQGTPQIVDFSENEFFAAIIKDGNVLWSTRSKESGLFTFQLFQKNNHDVVLLEEQVYNYQSNQKNVITTPLTENSTTEAIPSPMNPDLPNFPFRIGNSYAEHQNYGGNAYLHPGVDLLGIPQQPVYAPRKGYVKAIITTSGSIHWRLAMSNENTAEESEGYLFAHLDPATIPFVVGDEVQAGDFLGNIVEWPIFDFHHLHFARLKHSGTTWDGLWLTVDNVLADIINFSDTSPPVFEPLWDGNTIAFQAFGTNGDILSPDSLYGSFDIICHAHDLSNDDWRLEVNSLRYQLWEELTDPGPVFERGEAIIYDFELDAYGSEIVTDMIIETIYSNDQPWVTLGNYDERNFYQRVSRSNGDGVINVFDQLEFFDSTVFPDGNYTLRIYADDAKENENFTELAVRIKNNLSTSTVEVDPIKVHVFPNPSTRVFGIKTTAEVSYYEMVNALGQLVERKKVDHQQSWEVEIKDNGVYFLKVYGQQQKLLGLEKLVVE